MSHSIQKATYPHFQPTFYVVYAEATRRRFGLTPAASATAETTPMQIHPKPRTPTAEPNGTKDIDFVALSEPLALETILHGRKTMLCRVVSAVAVLPYDQKFGTRVDFWFISRCKYSEIQGGNRAVDGGELNFSKFIRDGFFPQYNLNPLIILKWQGKRGSGGKKLRRNLRLYLLECAAES